MLNDSGSVLERYPNGNKRERRKDCVGANGEVDVRSSARMINEPELGGRESPGITRIRPQLRLPSNLKQSCRSSFGESSPSWPPTPVDR